MLIVLFSFSFMCLMAQEEEWIQVPHIPSAITVEMPDLPDYENSKYYADEVAVPAETYSFKMDRATLYFELTALKDDSRKGFKQAMEGRVDYLAAYDHGQPGKPQTLSREDIQYRYVETPLSTGKVVRSVFFQHQGYLVHVYVKGERGTVYGISANYFLGSWKPDPNHIRETSTEVELDIETEANEDSPSGLPEQRDEWVSVTIDDALTIEFPEKPFKRKTVNLLQLHSDEVTSYACYANEYRMNYVVTTQPFEGDGPSDARTSSSFTYVIDRILEENRFKMIEERTVNSNGLERKEYILAKGIRFYRLQLLQVDDVLYQCLVKGKRCSINKPESRYFFETLKRRP